MADNESEVWIDGFVSKFRLKMDILRRNTDYALRLMVNLARRFGKPVVSSQVLSEEEDVSYHLTCKLLQKLSVAGLVKSQLGPKGGFRLTREPSMISLLEVVEAIQGPISLNRCLLSVGVCPKQKGCAVRARLIGLQECISGYLSGITLNELLQGRVTKRKRKARSLKRRKK